MGWEYSPRQPAQELMLPRFTPWSADFSANRNQTSSRSSLSCGEDSPVSNLLDILQELRLFLGLHRGEHWYLLWPCASVRDSWTLHQRENWGMALISSWVLRSVSPFSSFLNRTSWGVFNEVQKDIPDDVVGNDNGGKDKNPFSNGPRMKKSRKQRNQKQYNTKRLTLWACCLVSSFCDW